MNENDKTPKSQGWHGLDAEDPAADLKLTNPFRFLAKAA